MAFPDIVEQEGANEVGSIGCRGGNPECSPDRVVEVRDGSVVAAGPDGAPHEITGETLVLALGARSRIEEVEKLKGLAGEVHVVGDAVEARIIYDAVHEGFEAAMEI